MAKLKKKVKYDKWFLIVLTILLWSLCRQLFGLIGVIPYDLANYGLWLRLVACGIAIFGVLWVVKMYIMNTKRQARRNERIEKAIRKYPELKGIIKDIEER